MFRWTIDLSSNCIAMLLSFSEWEEGGKGPNLSEAEAPSPLSLEGADVRVAGKLINEGLVYHLEKRPAKKTGEAWNKHWKDQYWGLTEKGRLVVELVRMDAAKMQKAPIKSGRYLPGQQKKRRIR